MNLFDFFATANIRTNQRPPPPFPEPRPPPTNNRPPTPERLAAAARYCRRAPKMMPRSSSGVSQTRGGGGGGATRAVAQRSGGGDCGWWLDVGRRRRRQQPGTAQAGARRQSGCGRSVIGAAMPALSQCLGGGRRKGDENGACRRKGARGRERPAYRETVTRKGRTKEEAPSGTNSCSQPLMTCNTTVSIRGWKRRGGGAARRKRRKRGRACGGAAARQASSQHDCSTIDT